MLEAQLEAFLPLITLAVEAAVATVAPAETVVTIMAAAVEAAATVETVDKGDNMLAAEAAATVETVALHTPHRAAEAAGVDSSLTAVPVLIRAMAEKEKRQELEAVVHLMVAHLVVPVALVPASSSIRKLVTLSDV